MSRGKKGLFKKKSLGGLSYTIPPLLLNWLWPEETGTLLCFFSLSWGHDLSIWSYCLAGGSSNGLAAEEKIKVRIRYRTPGLINALIKAKEFAKKFVCNQARSASGAPFGALLIALCFASRLITSILVRGLISLDRTQDVLQLKRNCKSDSPFCNEQSCYVVRMINAFGEATHYQDTCLVRAIFAKSWRKICSVLKLLVFYSCRSLESFPDAAFFFRWERAAEGYPVAPPYGQLGLNLAKRILSTPFAGQRSFPYQD